MLEQESAAWGQALGCLLRACVRAMRPRAGEPDLFATAAARLEAADLGVFAAAARYRQGERTEGDEGQRLRDEALAWLAGQGVRDPLRMIRSHAPTPTRNEWASVPAPASEGPHNDEVRQTGDRKPT